MKSSAALAAAALLLCSAAALADVDAAAQVGFSGRWVEGAATPMAVTLSNSGPEPVRVRVTVSQSERMGNGELESVREIDLASGVTREEMFVVPGPRQWSGGMHVALEVEPTVPIHAGGETGNRGSLAFDVGRDSLSQDNVGFATRVLGITGDTRGSIGSRLRLALDESTLKGLPGGRANDRVETFDVDPKLLRLASLAFEGLDAVLVCDPGAEFAAAPAETEALLDWVATGGRLIVSLGEHAGSFTTSPLAAHMPGTWTGSHRTSYGELVQTLAGSESPSGASGPWTPIRAADPGYENAANTWQGGPLRLERSFGMGRIVLLPYDLKAAFSLVPAEDKFARALLQGVLDLPEVRDSAVPEFDQFGSYLNFSSALARTLQAGAFEPPPLPLVVLGILLYVLVVGPLDWFVLKRLRKQRLTTLTFAGAVATFTLLAYGASLFLFSSGARVNRVVFADLADAGQGRQLLRVQDLAGYYSPTGNDREVAYESPAVILPGALPGLDLGGDVGTTLPVVVSGSDALRPRALVQLAFRSQRVLRGVSLGTTGPSIEVEWTGEGNTRGVRVINGLPIDLESVSVYIEPFASYALGPLAAGATSGDGKFDHSIDDAPFNPGTIEGSLGSYWADSLSTDEIRSLIEAMSVEAWLPRDARNKPPRDETAALRKAGIDRSEAFARGNALVVAFARKLHVPLPGDDTPGETYVVLRKEVPLP